MSDLDVFGELLMEQLRDAAIGYYESLAQGHWRAPALQKLQSDLASMDEGQREVVRRCVIAALDNGIHDFLFSLEIENDNQGRVQVTVDGINVADLSDGLQGEPFGEHGWRAKFSTFPE